MEQNEWLLCLYTAICDVASNVSYTPRGAYFNQYVQQCVMKHFDYPIGTEDYNASWLRLFLRGQPTCKEIATFINFFVGHGPMRGGGNTRRIFAIPPVASCRWHHFYTREVAFMLMAIFEDLGARHANDPVYSGLIAKYFNEVVAAQIEQISLRHRAMHVTIQSTPWKILERVIDECITVFDSEDDDYETLSDEINPRLLVLQKRMVDYEMEMKFHELWADALEIGNVERKPLKSIFKKSAPAFSPLAPLSKAINSGLPFVDTVDNDRVREVVNLFRPYCEHYKSRFGVLTGNTVNRFRSSSDTFETLDFTDSVRPNAYITALLESGIFRKFQSLDKRPAIKEQEVLEREEDAAAADLLSLDSIRFCLHMVRENRSKLDNTNQQSMVMLFFLDHLLTLYMNMEMPVYNQRKNPPTYSFRPVSPYFYPILPYDKDMALTLTERGQKGIQGVAFLFGHWDSLYQSTAAGGSSSHHNLFYYHLVQLLTCVDERVLGYPVRSPLMYYSLRNENYRQLVAYNVKTAQNNNLGKPISTFDYIMNNIAQGTVAPPFASTKADYTLDSSVSEREVRDNARIVDIPPPMYISRIIHLSPDETVSSDSDSDGYSSGDDDDEKNEVVDGRGGETVKSPEKKRKLIEGEDEESHTRKRTTPDRRPELVEDDMVMDVVREDFALVAVTDRDDLKEWSTRTIKTLSSENKLLKVRTVQHKELVTVSADMIRPLHQILFDPPLPDRNAASPLVLEDVHLKLAIRERMTNVGYIDPIVASTIFFLLSREDTEARQVYAQAITDQLRNFMLLEKVVIIPIIDGHNDERAADVEGATHWGVLVIHPAGTHYYYDSKESISETIEDGDNYKNAKKFLKAVGYYENKNLEVIHLVNPQVYNWECAYYVIQIAHQWHSSSFADDHPGEVNAIISAIEHSYPAFQDIASGILSFMRENEVVSDDNIEVEKAKSDPVKEVDVTAPKNELKRRIDDSYDRRDLEKEYRDVLANPPDKSIATSSDFAEFYDSTRGAFFTNETSVSAKLVRFCVKRILLATEGQKQLSKVNGKEEGNPGFVTLKEDRGWSVQDGSGNAWRIIKSGNVLSEQEKKKIGEDRLMIVGSGKDPTEKSTIAALCLIRLVAVEIVGMDLGMFCEHDDDKSVEAIKTEKMLQCAYSLVRRIVNDRILAEWLGSSFSDLMEEENFMDSYTIEEVVRTLLGRQPIFGTMYIDVLRTLHDDYIRGKSATATKVSVMVDKAIFKSIIQMPDARSFIPSIFIDRMKKKKTSPMDAKELRDALRVEWPAFIENLVYDKVVLFIPIFKQDWLSTITAYFKEGKDDDDDTILLKKLNFALTLYSILLKENNAEEKEDPSYADLKKVLLRLYEPPHGKGLAPLVEAFLSGKHLLFNQKNGIFPPELSLVFAPDNLPPVEPKKQPAIVIKSGLMRASSTKPAPLVPVTTTPRSGPPPRKSAVIENKGGGGGGGGKTTLAFKPIVVTLSTFILDLTKNDTYAKNTKLKFNLFEKISGEQEIFNSTDEFFGFYEKGLFVNTGSYSHVMLYSFDTKKLANNELQRKVPSRSELSLYMVVKFQFAKTDGSSRPRRVAEIERDLLLEIGAGHNPRYSHRVTPESAMEEFLIGFCNHVLLYDYARCQFNPHGMLNVNRIHNFSKMEKHINEKKKYKEYKDLPDRPDTIVDIIVLEAMKHGTLDDFIETNLVATDTMTPISSANEVNHYGHVILFIDTVVQVLGFAYGLARDMGIFHHDLKPANIGVQSYGGRRGIRGVTSNEKWVPPSDERQIFLSYTTPLAGIKFHLPFNGYLLKTFDYGIASRYDDDHSLKESGNAKHDVETFLLLYLGAILKKKEPVPRGGGRVWDPLIYLIRNKWLIDFIRKNIRSKEEAQSDYDFHGKELVKRLNSVDEKKTEEREKILDEIVRYTRAESQFILIHTMLDALEDLYMSKIIEGPALYRYDITNLLAANDKNLAKSARDEWVGKSKETSTWTACEVLGGMITKVYHANAWCKFKKKHYNYTAVYGKLFESLRQLPGSKQFIHEEGEEVDPNRFIIEMNNYSAKNKNQM